MITQNWHAEGMRNSITVELASYNVNEMVLSYIYHIHIYILIVKSEYHRFIMIKYILQ